SALRRSNKIQMVCTERERLEEQHTKAGAAFAWANDRLRARIGICPKEEFVSLSNAVNEAWEALMRARTALDSHVRAHGCESAHETSTAI
ncbi:MAG: hypothetical protein WBE37_13265, partial [Bryobacteraceae bacterium]